MTTIHFVGLGAIGTLYAIGLQRSSSGIKIQAILSSSNGSLVRYLRPLNGAPSLHMAFERDDPPTAPISHLVVCTKAQRTLSALRPLYPRISSKTSVLLLQNGALGVEAELSKDFQSIGMPLPQFLLGSTTHGVAIDRNANDTHPCYQHTGLGVTYVGATSNLNDSLDLLHHFSLLPSELNVHIIQNPTELRKHLLIKVIVNCCLNCLSVLFLVRNGLLVESDHGIALIRQLTLESHSILRSDLDGLSKGALEQIVIDVATKTSKNHNSMMVDVMNGRDTEIEYILGYLLNLAKERKLSMPLHQFLYSLTRMKSDLVTRDPHHARVME